MSSAARLTRRTASQTLWGDSPVLRAASLGGRPSTRTSLAAVW
jgi:hypothetical protein